MQRRSILISLVFLAACASAPAPPTPAPNGFISERIAIATRGHGPDVILIPGLTSSASVWDATAAALESRYTIHVVQVKGFAGIAPEANAQGTVSAPVAEEIARYIAERRIEHPAVIGHSMGGTIALMLAARHPTSVGRVMVVDMFPFMGAMFGPPGATVEMVRPTADQIRGQMLAAPPGAAAPMLEQMISNMVRTESVRPELLRQARESSRGTVANAFHELIVTDLRPELPNISAPLTVLYVIPPNSPVPAAQYESYMRLSYANVPDVRVVKVEESYHFIMIDAFDRFMREVNAFLTAR